jgi:hypothetical protein
MNHQSPPVLAEGIYGGGDRFRRVDDHHITGLEEIGQVGEPVVFDRSGRSVSHHETHPVTGFPSPLSWRRRRPRFRQGEVDRPADEGHAGSMALVAW